MKRGKRDVKTASAILKTYSSGASLAELKDRFGIRGKNQLAGAVLDALIASGKMPPVARGKRAKQVPSEFKVAVNKRGTIVIPKEAVVDAFRLKGGQTLTAKRWGKKIILAIGG